MKFSGTRARALFLAALSLAVALAGPAGAKPTRDVIERAGLEGSINWSQGYMEAKGTVLAPQKDDPLCGKLQAKSMAIEAARLAARQNLLEAARTVRIDSTARVKDSMDSDAEIASRALSMVNAAQVTAREVLPDGAVAITLRMPLPGGFTELFLPQEFMTVPDVKTVVSIQEGMAPGPDLALSLAETAPEEGVPRTGSQVFTGMVVDARGIGVHPAMAPRILDEGGREVFGSAYVSREFAVSQGVAGYARDLEAALEDKRVAGRPLLVKGVKAEGPGKSDVIISKADADLVRGASDNLSLLKKCRVIIVVE